LKLTPGPKLKELKIEKVSLNGMPYNWKHLQEGVSFDILPRELKLKMDGADASGQPRQINFTIVVPIKQSDIAVPCPGCEKCQPGLPKTKPGPKEEPPSSPEILKL